MGVHDERQAPARHGRGPAPHGTRGSIAQALRGAIGGIYEPHRYRVLAAIVTDTLAAGGPAAIDVFYAACYRAAMLDAHGRPPAQTLSRAHAGDACAREGAPVPPDEVAP